MTKQSEPNSTLGLTIEQAIREYADPELLASWDTAVAERKRYRSPERLYRGSPEHRAKMQLVARVARTEQAVFDDLRSQLRKERRVAWGATPDPLAERQRIRAAAWLNLEVHDAARSVLKGPNRLRIYSVLIYTSVDAQSQIHNDVQDLASLPAKTLATRIFDALDEDTKRSVQKRGGLMKVAGDIHEKIAGLGKRCTVNTVYKALDAYVRTDYPLI